MPLKSIGDINLSHWMRDQYELIKDKKLKDIAMPGTHDSATCDINSSSELGEGQSWMSLPGVSSFVYKLAKTQDLTIKEQLMIGVRYFDLRIIAHRTDFYTTHGLISTRLKTILRDIKEFMDTHPYEVIILEFNAHHKFINNDHARLGKLMYETFMFLMAAPHLYAEASFSEFVEKNQRIIVMYNYQPLYNENSGLRKIQTPLMSIEDTYRDNWGSYYPVIVKFKVANENYVFIHKEDGKWYIEKLLPDGGKGQQKSRNTDSGQWRNFYPTVFAYTVQDQTFLFCQNRDGYWATWEILYGGKSGKEPATGKWKFYDKALSYSVFGKTFMFGIRNSDNRWFIQELLPEGKMGDYETDSGMWNFNCGVFNTYSINGRAYMFGQTTQGRCYWWEMTYNGTMKYISEQDWNDYYPSVCSFKWNDKLYQFACKGSSVSKVLNRMAGQSNGFETLFKTILNPIGAIKEQYENLVEIHDSLNEKEYRWYIREILPNGLLGDEIDVGRFGYYTPIVFSFECEKGTFLGGLTSDNTYFTREISCVGPEQMEIVSMFFWNNTNNYYWKSYWLKDYNCVGAVMKWFESYHYNKEFFLEQEEGSGKNNPNRMLFLPGTVNFPEGDTQEQIEFAFRHTLRSLADDLNPKLVALLKRWRKEGHMIGGLTTDFINEEVVRAVIHFNQ
ncbi:hypothetical protein ABK040_011712 [Willaertia magna]